MNYQIKTFLKRERKIAEYAVEMRANKKDWYVLKYNTKTTEYNNEIVFKTLNEAYKEFMNTNPTCLDERIELIFSPDRDDTVFSDNIVVNYK